MSFFQRLKVLFSVGIFLGCTVILSGCGGLNSQFSCPMKPGVTCQSLDQVNSLIDQGKLAQSASPVDIHLADADDSNHHTIQRTPDTVMRLWIAPYEDSQGNYFSSTRVYHVIQPGSWSTESLVKDKANA